MYVCKLCPGTRVLVLKQHSRCSLGSSRNISLLYCVFLSLLSMKEHVIRDQMLNSYKTGVVVSTGCCVLAPGGAEKHKELFSTTLIGTVPL